MFALTRVFHQGKNRERLLEVGEPRKHKAHMHTYMMTIEDSNINPNDVISFLTGPVRLNASLIFRVMSSDGDYQRMNVGIWFCKQ